MPFLLVACILKHRATQKHTDMIKVPAGNFIMGISQSKPEDNGPEHEIWLNSFWIDKYEVTNDQYHRCVTADECNEPEDLLFYNDKLYAYHPVVYITWYDARDYCKWKDKRLPSEAEWEKAARGNDSRLYPWGNELFLELLNANNQNVGTMPVGNYPEGASPYGVLDMAGNVWEWVDNWYTPYPGSDFQSDLFGEKYKVVRGGSWNHPAEDARATQRDIAHPQRAIRVVGFRCASTH